MKKLTEQTVILLSAFLLSSGMLFGQYQSIFGQTQTAWHWGHVATLDGDVCVDSMWVLPNSDTVIYGKKAKAFKFAFIYQSCFPAYEIAYLAEDASSGKVWCMPWINLNGDSNFYLVMDLSLTIGDTFTGITNAPGPYIVDSIYYLNGRKHIRFNQNAFKARKFEMIEGVGTNLGVHPMSYGQWSYLICKKNDYISIYESNGFSGINCDNMYSLQTKMLLDNNKLVKIFPNPVVSQSHIMIEIPKAGQGKIALYSITGKLLQTVYQGQFLQGKQTFTLHRSDFGSAGIYILRITINGQTVNKKVAVR